MTELGLATEWIGKGNRESQTLPVLDLRESAQKAGLLRGETPADGSGPRHAL